MLGGVAGGVAAYLQVDSALVRLAFAALVLAAGAGFLIYVIAWIVIPEEPKQSATSMPSESTAAPAALAAAPASGPPSRPRSGPRGARLVVGAILVAVGSLLLLDWLIPDLNHFFWPGAIITLGLGLLVYGARR